MAQTKSNLPKTTVTTNKIKNKRVNKLELTVRLHENPIKTKIKALFANWPSKFIWVIINNSIP